MKVNNKHLHKQRSLPCPYRKQLESNHPEKETKPQLFGYTQACALLQAIELNRRKRLSKKCLGNPNKRMYTSLFKNIKLYFVIS